MSGWHPSDYHRRIYPNLTFGPSPLTPHERELFDVALEMWPGATIYGDPLEDWLAGLPPTRLETV